jgi:hypothetical protein
MQRVPLATLAAFLVLSTPACQDSLAADLHADDASLGIMGMTPSPELLQAIGQPTPDLVTLEPFARSAFPHPIDGKFKFKYHARTHVVQLDDVSDVIAARITIQEGGSAGWHVHPGSLIGVVHSGTFGVIEAHDCVLRTYSAGQAFIHPGQGMIDVGFNAGDGDVVVYLTFLGVPEGQPPSLPAPHPGC